MSKRYSHYWIWLSVGYLGEINVRITDINKNNDKEVFDGSDYTFEHLFKAYEDAKEELLKVPELKKLVERKK